MLVANGTYYENINFKGKNIIVASLYINSQDTTDIHHSIIDGGGDSSVVCFISGESDAAQLIGFTIIHGMNEKGGGILCTNGASPALRNLLIRDNNADSYGGGLYCENETTITLSDTRIYNNSASQGGSIYSLNSEINLENCILTHNTASAEGGALYCYNSEAQIINVTITENTATMDGGAIFADENSHVVLLNSILWGDSPQEIYFSAGGIPDTAIIAYSLVDGSIENIITNNNGLASWLSGNISTDPYLVNTTLSPALQAVSPAIGAGMESLLYSGTSYQAPETDLLGNARPSPAGSHPDLGAYEHIRSYPQLLPPDSLSAQPSNQQVTLTWQPNTETYLNQYHIYRGTSSPAQTLIDSILAGTIEDTVYTDSSLTNGQPYYYRITAVDTAVEESDFSGEVSATPYDDQAPQPPQNIRITDSLQAVTVQWYSNPEADLAYYQVYRSDMDQFLPDSSNRLSKVFAPDTVYIDSLITNGSIYYYAVTAVDTAGNESDLSAHGVTTAIYIDVWNVDFSQNTDGSLQVNILYSFSGHDTVHYNITPYLQGDPQDAWVQISNVSGDVGDQVLAGENKEIIWDMGSELQNYYTQNAKIKIVVSTATSKISIPINFQETDLERER